MSEGESTHSSSSSYIIVEQPSNNDVIMRSSSSERGYSEADDEEEEEIDELSIACSSRRSSMGNCGGGKRAPLQRHGVECKLCLEEIKGERWICLECSGWSLCKSCFHSVSDEVHPLHTFIRARSPDDIYTPTANTREQPIVHLDVLCSSCQCPILGVRYECIADGCESNLCQGCETLPLQVHKVSHAKVKYNIPKERVATSSILNYNKKEKDKERESFENKNQPVEKSNKGLWELDDQIVTTEDMLRARSELCMAIEFDKETPWGSRVSPGASFTRSWDIINKGSLAWPKGTTVSRISPAKFSPPYFRKRIVSDDVVCVGKSVEIQFKDFKAPLEGGTHVEIWALSDYQGRFFGERLEIRIFVGDEDKYASDRYLGLAKAMDGIKEGQEDLQRQKDGAIGGEPCKMFLLRSTLRWNEDHQKFDCDWRIRNIGKLNFPKGCRLRRLHASLTSQTSLQIDDSNAYISLPCRSLHPNKEETIEITNLKVKPKEEKGETESNESIVDCEGQETRVERYESTWFGETWALIDNQGTEIGQRLSFEQSFRCTRWKVNGIEKIRFIPEIVRDPSSTNQVHGDDGGGEDDDDDDNQQIIKRRTIKSYGDNHTIEIF